MKSKVNREIKPTVVLQEEKEMRSRNSVFTSSKKEVNDLEGQG